MANSDTVRHFHKPILISILFRGKQSDFDNILGVLENVDSRRIISITVR